MNFIEAVKQAQKNKVVFNVRDGETTYLFIEGRDIRLSKFPIRRDHHTVWFCNTTDTLTDDWQIEEEYISFEEAFEALKRGKKIRHQSWHTHTFIYIKDNVGRYKSNKGCGYESRGHLISLQDMLENKWEIYEEEL